MLLFWIRGFSVFAHIADTLLPLLCIKCVCNTLGWIFMPLEMLHVLIWEINC